MRISNGAPWLATLDLPPARPWSRKSFLPVLQQAWARAVRMPLHRILDELLRAGDLAELRQHTLADIGLRRE